MPNSFSAHMRPKSGWLAGAFEPHHHARSLSDRYTHGCSEPVGRTSGASRRCHQHPRSRPLAQMSAAVVVQFTGGKTALLCLFFLLALLLGRMDLVKQFRKSML